LEVKPHKAALQFNATKGNSMKAISLSLFLLAAGPLLGQTETTIYVVDKDKDQKITRVEFINSVETKAQLSAWDANSDGFVGFDEFTKGVFRAWDRDNNGEIILSEFNDDIPYWYNDIKKAETFAIWDKNSDGEVHLDELRDGVKKTGLSLSFYQDINKPLALADFQERVYTFWDTDRDGVVSVKEYDANRGRWVIVNAGS
jgi:Ca2+-binding EF-hand superfamily protein